MSKLDDMSLFETNGYAILRSIIDEGTIRRMRAEAEQLADAFGSPAGIRDVLQKLPTFASASESPRIRQFACRIAGDSAQVVRSILFDKTSTANWDVAWHQDVTIAVQRRIDNPGFGPWSVKLGTPHVQPPANVLSKMVTMRIHLDDCAASNGPLLVVPGSHRELIDVRQLDVEACNDSAVSCEVLSGDAVLMRPLILHASRKSANPSHRRVLHLEFAGHPLPGGLEWTKVKNA